MIEATKIAENRYATPEAADVKLYNFNGCEKLTIGQLVNAVCCRIGMALEAQSVVKANILAGETNTANAYAVILSGVTGKTLDYDSVLTCEGFEGTTVRRFLEDQGFAFNDVDNREETELPPTIAEINEQIELYDKLRGRCDSLANTSQKDMIDLQTCVSRRDVAFATATNVVRTLGTVLQTAASNF